MKKYFIIPIILMMLSGFTWRQEKNDVFVPGEKLTFDIRWKFITVGSATMEVEGIEEINGRKCYHIVTKANSAPFFDAFFKVRDVNESWVDVESLCSVKFINNISEGKYKKTETLILDQENHTFTLIEAGKADKTGTIPSWVQDVLSSMYYLRTKDIEVKGNYSIDSHSGDKSWPLMVKVLKKKKVNVPAGKFNCFMLEPGVREGAGIFKAKGKMWVWLTDDDKKIPVLMRSKVFIGSITAKLVKYKLQ